MVVVRPKDEIQKLLPEGVTVVEAKDAHLGMGHSLASGVRQLTDSTTWLFVALADMPWLKTETLELLVSKMSSLNQGVLRPSFNGKAGHPVGFTHHYIKSLSQLKGDEGARNLIESEKANLNLIEVCDAGVLQDVDRPEHLIR